MSRRVLIYSHDTFGIGNIRRTFELCTAMSRRLPDLSILVITGSAMADTFPIPANVDYVKLPALRREGRGDYRARAQGFASADLRSMRTEICLTAAERFSPDLVLVDKAPFGVDGELAPALERLSRSRPDCLRILALRDIIDAGEVVRDDWERDSVGQSIARHYDGIWVFGTPALFDVAREYALPPATAEKLNYLGFMGRNDPPIASHEVRRQLDLNGGPLILATAGGGDDGEHLLSTYARSLDALERAEPGLQTVLVSGPQASPDLRQRLAAACDGHSRRRFLAFSPDLLSLMNAADAVVSMGGYNTSCELLWLRKRALVVPRNRPVQEQIVRARRLSELGAILMCPPDELSTSRLVSETQLLLHGFKPAVLDQDRFRFDALERASEMVARLIASPVAAAAAAARVSTGAAPGNGRRLSPIKQNGDGRGW
jgi:predicted glycosyltransferase